MFNKEYIVELVLTITAALISLGIHEFSHALAAYKLGDPTAKNLGRLSINPLKHLDPFGALCMIFFHFGWAKPVPINARNFKDPRRGFALSALAGPLSNIILSFLLALIFLICANTFHYTENAFLNALMQNTLNFFYIFHAINVGLGVFNLIPIPPFDGSRLLGLLLPPKWYFKIMKHEKYIYWGVIAWLLLGRYVYTTLMSFSLISSNAFLSGIARCFSLSHLLSDAISFISEIMMRFWTILPFLNYPF